ncbi:putative integral membrane protein [Babesia bovis T2Bo]|uniref:Membrane protein, putative n=1 Tax=Babesia bovis TaxID=5865 RepID=A7AME5_BABBO|nr:putative integral membrane protein [Babesia bovis T2Bo]EDO07729.1 putative integral membrane protein [Babesia bovis T2Bo]|eukprot:XP_001611297.1 membrane protein [Babesia bovis T2Bo]
MVSAQESRRQKKFWLILGSCFLLACALLGVIVAFAVQGSGDEPSKRFYKVTVFNDKGEEKVTKLSPENFYKSLKANIEYMGSDECEKSAEMREVLSDIFDSIVKIAIKDRTSAGNADSESIQDGSLEHKLWYMEQKFGPLTKAVEPVKDASTTAPEGSADAAIATTHGNTKTQADAESASTEPSQKKESVNNMETEAVSTSTPTTVTTPETKMPGKATIEQTGTPVATEGSDIDVSQSLRGTLASPSESNGKLPNALETHFTT